MHFPNTPDDGRPTDRRTVLKGAAAGLAALGGFTAPAAAMRKVTPLTDRGADVLIYWSEVDDSRTDPDHPEDFGFPGPSTFTPPGGLTFAGHDPAGGGLFDFGRIVMRHNGDLVNTKWLILGGAVLATEPESYKLKHLGGGLYRSRAQRMRFTAQSAEDIEAFLERALGAIPSLPIFDRLGGKKWFAVGDEFAQLDLDGDGNPDPAMPMWGATRIDFYERPRMDYGLSLIYAIGADDSGSPNPEDSPQIPNALGVAGELILNGRPLPGSGVDDDRGRGRGRDD